MAGAPVLQDRARAEQFSAVGRTRLAFDDCAIWTDADGFCWAGVRTGGHVLAFGWFAPGPVFEPELDPSLAEMVAKAKKLALREHRRRLRNAAARHLRLGHLTERLLWKLHQRMLEARASRLKLAAPDLGCALWGSQRENWPVNWRAQLLKLLKGLCWLHVAEWPDDQDEPPELGRHTVLVTRLADLREFPDENQCDDDCRWRGGERHDHIQVDIGRGFLGVLEQFGTEDAQTGVRIYDFKVQGKKSQGPSLRQVGRTGQLISVFLPARLGEPERCSTLNPQQHRLLAAIFREATRTQRQRRKDFSELEVLIGPHALDLRGKPKDCPLLEPGVRYVGFNGNKKRRGLGYLVTSEKGWLPRTSYALGEVTAFIEDLEKLSQTLGIVATGMSPAGWHSLKDLAALSLARAAAGRLRRVHLRLYAPADYLERWSAFFGWNDHRAQAPPSVVLPEQIGSLKLAMRHRKVSCRTTAAALGVDQSFLAKLLRGDKRWPAGLYARARQFVLGQPEAAVMPAIQAVVSGRRPMLAVAQAYLARGWPVIPQEVGKKKPHVRWTEFQSRLPTNEELAAWWEQWPSAGALLICGPLSGVLVIDVDGDEAYETLLAKLGREPRCPKAYSGKGDPHRFHLFFRHPDIATGAKYTPWHPKLEFRGHAGLVVLAPSIHKSGNRYRWAEHQSLDDLSLPEVPHQILEELRKKYEPPVSQPSRRFLENGSDIASLSPRTRDFLTGRYADKDGWNCRIFQAACDCQGHGLPLETAQEMLLAGARPRTREDESLAVATIASAYSKPREPSWY